MSEDKTKDIGEKYTTQPTIQTVLERLDDFRASMEKRFESLDIRLDRIESEVHKTQGNFHALRADFNELRAQLKENLHA